MPNLDNYQDVTSKLVDNKFTDCFVMITKLKNPMLVYRIYFDSKIPLSCYFTPPSNRQ